MEKFFVVAVFFVVTGVLASTFLLGDTNSLKSSVGSVMTSAVTKVETFK